MISSICGHHGRPSISIIAHNAYGALTAIDTGHIGGVERQTSLMAKWFAKRGYQVSILTCDEGQDDGIEIDGVRVFKMCRKDAGIKGLRFFWPKWTSLYRAMAKANADIYYYNTGDQALGQITLWCRRYSRKCVYSVAATYNAKTVKFKALTDRFFFIYGLKHTNSIIAQTQQQQQMLLNDFGVVSTVIPMPFEGFNRSLNDHKVNFLSQDPHVLWVGRISKVKRLEWLLDVAEQCPQITFHVVGASNKYSDYNSALKKRAADIRNVKMYGRIPHEEIAKYYQSCHILCCTSAREGFPNTFLEAWSLGIPVVSTFDPDNIVSKYGLGWTASNVDELVKVLNTATTSPQKWIAASHAARSFYLKNHTLEVTMPKFEKIFLDVV